MVEIYFTRSRIEHDTAEPSFFKLHWLPGYTRNGSLRRIGCDQARKCGGEFAVGGERNGMKEDD